MWKIKKIKILMIWTDCKWLGMGEMVGHRLKCRKYKWLLKNKCGILLNNQSRINC